MLGFPVCLAMAGLNTRESTLFATLWTIKIVMDHCGYDFPYSPWNLMTPHAPLFHDLHHQSWGLKVKIPVAFSPSLSAQNDPTLRI